MDSIKRRPTAVTVFGVMNIVFGAYSLTLAPLAIIIGILFTRKLYASAPWYLNWIAVSYVMQWASSVISVVAGIGLLKLRRWARLWSIGLGVYQILHLLINLTLSQFVPTSAEPDSPIFRIGLTIIFGFLALIYPVLLIIFMQKPHIVAAFAEERQEPAEISPGKAVSTLAIASLVLAVTGFLNPFLVGSLIAVICGHMALTRIESPDSRVYGKGMAVAGIVVGYIGIALSIIFILFIGVVLWTGLDYMKGADIKAISNEIRTQLDFAATTGDIETVKLLIEKARISTLGIIAA